MLHIKINNNTDNCLKVKTVKLKKYFAKYLEFLFKYL